MSRAQWIGLCLVGVSIVSCSDSSKPIERTGPLDVTLGAPTNLTECWARLDEVLPAEQRAALLVADDSKEADHLRRWLRENWRGRLFDHVERLGQEEGHSRFSEPYLAAKYIVDSYRTHLETPKLTEAEFVRLERQEYLEAMRAYREKFPYDPNKKRAPKRPLESRESDSD